MSPMKLKPCTALTLSDIISGTAELLIQHSRAIIKIFCLSGIRDFAF